MYNPSVRFPRRHIPDYLTININMVYRFPDMGAFKSPTLKLNLHNITDRHYLGYVNGTTANALATTCPYGTSIRGGSSTFSMTAPFMVMGGATRRLLKPAYNSWDILLIFYAIHLKTQDIPFYKKPTDQQ